MENIFIYQGSKLKYYRPKKDWTLKFENLYVADAQEEAGGVPLFRPKVGKSDGDEPFFITDGFRSHLDIPFLLFFGAKKMTNKIDILILVLIGLFLITIQPTTVNAENQANVIDLTNAFNFKDIKHSYFDVRGISIEKEKLARESLFNTHSSSTYKVVEMPRIGSSEELKFYRSTANIRLLELDYLNGLVALESPESNEPDWWVESSKGTFIKPFMSEKGSVFGYLSRVEGHGISVSIDLDDDGIVDILEITRPDFSVESWVKEDGPAKYVLEDLLMGKDFCSAINSLDEMNTLDGTNPSFNPFFNVNGPGFNPFDFCSRHNDNKESPIIIGGGGGGGDSDTNLFDLSDKCKSVLTRAGVTSELKPNLDMVSDGLLEHPATKFAEYLNDTLGEVGAATAAIGGVAKSPVLVAVAAGLELAAVTKKLSGDAAGIALADHISPPEEQQSVPGSVDPNNHQGVIDPDGYNVQQRNTINPITGQNETHVHIIPPHLVQGGSNLPSSNESPSFDPSGGGDSITKEQFDAMLCKRQAESSATRRFIGSAIKEKCSDPSSQPSPAETSQDQIVLQTYCNANQKDHIASLNGLIWRNNTACAPTEQPDVDGNCSGWSPAPEASGGVIEGFGVKASQICDPKVCNPYLGVDAVVETNLEVNADFGTNLHNFILDNRNLPAIFNSIEQH